MCEVVYSDSATFFNDGFFHFGEFDAEYLKLSFSEEKLFNICYSRSNYNFFKRVREWTKRMCWS